MTNWNDRWMGLANHVSTWSKDRSRHIGAVIVDPRQVVVSLGWNGFPRGVNDDVDERHARPTKYLYSEHAERNAIYNAAASGHPTLGCSIYVNFFPCSDCARAIIQAGIARVYGIEPDWNDLTYAADFAATRAMFEEAGVGVTFLPGYAPPVRRPDRGEGCCPSRTEA